MDTGVGSSAVARASTPHKPLLGWERRVDPSGMTAKTPAQRRGRDRTRARKLISMNLRVPAELLDSLAFRKPGAPPKSGRASKGAARMRIFRAPAVEANELLRRQASEALLLLPREDERLGAATVLAKMKRLEHMAVCNPAAHGPKAIKLLASARSLVGLPPARPGLGPPA